MKKFDSLVEHKIPKSYIKRYVLFHANDIDDVPQLPSKEEMENEGIENTEEYIEQYIADNIQNTYKNNDYEYLTPYLEQDHRFVLDDNEHSSMYEIEYQINNIINDILQFESNKINNFDENEITNLSNFRVALIDGKDKGYYSDELINDIETDLLSFKTSDNLPDEDGDLLFDIKKKLNIIYE